MINNILYISSTVFPYGRAYSIRLQNFARLLHHLKIKLHIISDFTNEDFLNSDLIRSYEDATYQIVTGKPTSINRIKSTFNSIKIINEYLDNYPVDIVINGNCYDRFNKILKMCKKRKIPYVLEIGEWYDTRNWKLRNLNPYNFMYNKRIRKDYFKSDGVIAISRYLYNYFNKHITNVIRIPTILDTELIKYKTRTHNKKIVLVHMGFSGINKEKFRNVLIALKKMGTKRRCFEYNIYGSDMKTVLLNIGKDKDLLFSLADCVHVKGIVCQQEVHEIYMNADYSIFLRPRKRSSDAGFPTKLAESMAAGTPVITNNTGDIGLYLQDGIEGFLVEDTPQSILEVLNSLLVMSENEVERMRKNARNRAERSFDYHEYTKEIREFLERIYS